MIHSLYIDKELDKPASVTNDAEWSTYVDENVKWDIDINNDSISKHDDCPIEQSNYALTAQLLSVLGLPCPSFLKDPVMSGTINITPTQSSTISQTTVPPPPGIPPIPPPPSNPGVKPLALPTPQKCGSVVENYIRSYDGNTTYDITNNKTLTYTTIRNLCMALARESLVKIDQRSPEEARMERTRKNELMAEIARYRCCKYIGSAYDEDCTNMSITELENYLKNIKKYHDELKVREVLSGACEILGQGYGTIFPNGIPITQTKAVKFDGLSDEILNTLLSPTTTTGISFANILSKYNIRITDELCSLTAIMKALISKCKVVDIEPKPEEKK